MNKTSPPKASPLLYPHACAELPSKWRLADADAAAFCAQAHGGNRGDMLAVSDAMGRVSTSRSVLSPLSKMDNVRRQAWI